MGRIVGDKIILREFMASDLAPMRMWIVDSAVTRHLSGIFMKPQTVEQTREYLNKLLDGDIGGVNLVIAEKETLAYLGQLNLISVDQVARKAELAIVMAREHANKGYGQEAIALLLRFAFEQMNLHRVFLKVYAGNAPAVHVYEKLGFRIEGCLTDDLFRDGQYEDALIMGIIAPEKGGE